MDATCFISHSWADGEHAFAIKLADSLEERRIRKAWIDEREIPGGTSVQDYMLLNVQQCDVFLFLASPNSIKSRWCRQELAEALAQRNDAGLQIIPILLKGSSSIIPEEIRNLLYIDFTNAEAFAQSLEKLLIGIQEAYLIRTAVKEMILSDAGTRLAAVQTLNQIRNRSVVPALARRLLNEPDPTIRYWLAYTLGRTGGEQAYAALEEATLQETDLFAKQGILEGLEIIDRKNE